MTEKSATASVLWDRFGVGVSTICAIHCLFFPVLISLLPVTTFLPAMHDWAHPVFIITLIPIVYFASRRSHYDPKIVSFLTGGFIIVLIGWLGGHLLFGYVFETVVTLFGSVILIVGHWFNYRHHRQCKNHSHEHHPVAEKMAESQHQKETAE
ncbi:MerC domain-containing protein [Rhodohalobacter sp. 8-1]|uniref:MerC domain-containing protein n=1 Tax=Rhodohalobacter sp. 8-1 TaxID=3131972 RepID=UPI0030EF921F